MDDAATPGTRTIERLRAGFASPDPAARPMTRWWWFGPAVERTRLREELDAIAAAGYGGVEVSFVYPLSAETDRLLSPSFLADIRFAADEARARGLRCDLTLGSGWSFGGPHIDPTTAARRLVWERQEITPTASTLSVAPRWPGETFLAGFVGDGSEQELPESYEPLDVTDRMLLVPEGRGPRVVLLAWSRPTGQNVKRAAAGAEGPVLDHYSAAATDAHLSAFGDPLLDAVPGELLGSVFCDSLEVYEADWTPDMPAEFRRRRGYDLLPRLWALSPGQSPDGGGDIRRDVYATLAELYEENFVARVRAWAQTRGVAFRIQNYGEPPASISAYAAADAFEGEGWGWAEVTQTRWASSAANLYGRDVVSSEIWTWVHSPSFRATPLDLKGELHEHLLLGINQVVAHGWPYSPRAGDGLGWIFYAAGAIDDRNPWWPAMPRLLGYTHRLSWLMRQGRRVTDVGIYAPYDDVYAGMHEHRAKRLDLWAQVKRHVGDDVPRAVRTGGLDYDVFDDAATDVLDPARFPVVLLPNVTRLPARTADWLRRAEAAGVHVLRVAGSVDVGTPVTDLAAALRGLATPPLEVAGFGDDVVGRAVGVTYRRVDDVDVFLVANTSPRVQPVSLTPRVSRAVVERWDPETGDVVDAFPGSVTLVLQPYEAATLVAHDGTVSTAAPRAVPASERRLDGPWTVRYGDDGGGVVTLPHRWEDDPGRLGYSGSATYTTTVRDVPGAGEPGATVLLDLGPALAEPAGGTVGDGIRGRSFRAEVVPPVGVVAEVAVDGQPAGIAWHPPYVVGLGHLVGRGEHTLTITVHNTAANALADDRSLVAAAELSRERYGGRFRMQDLERARDTVASGLLAVPALRFGRAG